MPDLEDTPTEGELDTSAEAAQGASETEAPPWGDDFDAAKAWGTITKQRESEKELKEELRRIREDETARAALLKEWGYEVAADEDASGEELEFEDDDPVAPLTSKLSELEQWKEKQEAKEMAAQIRTDLTDIHGESDWDLDDKARRWIVYEASQDPKGFNRDALERAHKSLIDQWEAVAAQGVERAKKPKPKAPHVTAAGKAATGTKNTLDMTPDELREFARERYLASQQSS